LITSYFPNIERPLPSHFHKEVGPFLVQQRTTFVVAEEMLKQFDFEKGEGWVYDPHGVISTRKPTYKHHPNVLIENTSNLES
jgi:hypothetical protein